MAKEKRIIKQVKLFMHGDYANLESYEYAVNDFCIKILGETGNWPDIQVTSRYIGVIYEDIREIDFVYKTKIKTV
jgi:DNA-binding transcriptional regulator LsrR (DeoR family)